MTNQQILEKAVQKAIDGGWYKDAMNHTFVGNSVHFHMSEICFEMKSYNDIIFNHDFAKALWGGAESYIELAGTTIPARRWQAHLQAMVIADDPIKYLGEHLDN